MIRNRRGDTNRGWIISSLSRDFFITPTLPGDEDGEIIGKPAGKFMKTDAIYDTNPWTGMSAKEDYRHFIYWENPSPWEKESCLEDLHYD